MPVYSCECCGLNTTLKPNYTRHLASKSHKIMFEAKSKSKVSQNTSKSKPKVSLSEDYSCKYCNNTFKHKQSVSKHIKYSCKQNKDEDLKELVRLLNAQIQQNEKKIQLQEKNSTTIQNNLSCIKLSPGTLFYSVSGDDVVVDKGKQQNFIELLEIVKQIPVDSLSDDELKVTAKKLLHFYTGNF